MAEINTRLSAQTTDLKEYRRFRAWELHQEKGWTQQQIADVLGVTQGAVSQWFKRAREGGVEALRRQKAPGAQPWLTAVQKARLSEMLKRGAEAYGFRGEVWTRKRVAHVIKHEFGVTYTPRHVGRILAELNWSRQKPVTRASQRDEEAIRRWVQERWPELREKAEGEGYTIVFVDEAGFYLLPMVVRTYAPVGETPLIECLLTRDHLSAISGITPEGKLYMIVQPRSFKSPDVVRFLKHLLRHISGKILVIWDGAPIHRGQEIKDFLANGGSERILLERLPGYAPELNPDEGVWNYLKRVELKNIACRNVPHLRQELRKATRRLRRKRNIIRSCFSQAGLIRNQCRLYNCEYSIKEQPCQALRQNSSFRAQVVGLVAHKVTVTFRSDRHLQPTQRKSRQPFSRRLPPYQQPFLWHSIFFHHFCCYRRNGCR